MLDGCSVERLYLRWFSQFVCNETPVSGSRRLFCFNNVREYLASVSIARISLHLSIQFQNDFFNSRIGAACDILQTKGALCGGV